MYSRYDNRNVTTKLSKKTRSQFKWRTLICKYNATPMAIVYKLINLKKERAVDVMITRLRQKIEPDPKNPVYLQTVRGNGYVLWSD